MMGIRIKIGIKESVIPQNWEEVPCNSRLKIIETIYSKGLEIERMKALIQLPISIWEQVQPSQIYDILPHLKWVLFTPLTIPPVRSFRQKRIRFYLPKAKLENLVGIEFAFADAQLKAFSNPNTPDPAALDRLVAAICRPANEKFNAELIEPRAKKLKSLDPKIKIAVYHFFIGCKQWLMEKYQFQGGEESAGPDLGWTGILMDLARTGVFGDFEKTCYTPLHTLLVFLKKSELEYLQNKKP